MEAATSDPTGAAPGAEASASTPDFLGLAEQLAAKHGAGPAAAGPAPERNKGGRRTIPEEAADFLRKNGLVAVPADSVGAPGGPAGGAVFPPPEPPPPPVVSPDFVKTCADTLLKGIEAFRQQQIYLRTLKLSEDRELSREYADEAAAPPGFIDVMSLCAAEISRKYAGVNAVTPEIVLAVSAIAWIGKDLKLSKKLSDLAALKQQAENPAPATAS